MSVTAQTGKEPEVIHSRLWQDFEEPDNPFAAKACYCAGYDVYGDLLGKATWIEYLYLLFKHEAPSCSQKKVLEALAIAVANLGPREPSINAAMSAGAGGSTHASCLMAALAVGAGQLGGAHEVAVAMGYWRACGENTPAWHDRLRNLPKEERADVWLPMEHAAGFDPHGASCATPVRQTLASLARLSPGRSLPWLRAHREELEAAADAPLSMTGVAAAAMIDLGMTIDEGEMLYLLLRLPGAAAHALEQQGHGWRRFPFFLNGLVLEDDPGKTATAEILG